MNRKIIFISSLGHSGSTLTDLILGSHSRLIGLGEIARIIEKDLNQTRGLTCACGKKVPDCIFWGKVHKNLEQNQNISFREKYKLILDLFYEIFGNDFIPVDSSKYLRNLEYLFNLDFDIKVVYLIKDVRNFTISRLDNNNRKNISNNLLTPGKLFREWYKENFRFIHFFKQNNLDFFQCGYEELCLYSDNMINKICEFLEIEVEPGMINLAESSSHVVRGNRMSKQSEKKVIRYDNRWFMRNEWRLPSLIYKNIMKFNMKNVYINNNEAMWKK